MKTTLLENNGNRIFALIFDQGDDPLPNLVRFASDKNIESAHFTAIGAFSRVTLGYFDLDRQDYHKIPIDEQVEVLSLVGNISRYDDEPKVHAHVVVGKRDGTAHGGHLLDATVRPTLEVVLTVSPGYLRRTFDERYGIPLIDV
jgi:predicted DNA-binding protein with PD1-like motif